jgi:hypothetical protein
METLEGTKRRGGILGRKRRGRYSGRLRRSPSKRGRKGRGIVVVEGILHS